MGTSRPQRQRQRRTRARLLGPSTWLKWINSSRILVGGVLCDSESVSPLASTTKEKERAGKATDEEKGSSTTARKDRRDVPTTETVMKGSKYWFGSFSWIFSMRMVTLVCPGGNRFFGLSVPVERRRKRKEKRKKERNQKGEKRKNNC